MKANQRARARATDDDAGAEVIGALILFGVFVAAISILNVTAVPSAGRSAEQDHYERTLSSLNALQSEAEASALPGATGSTVARSLDLAPPRSAGQDFFSYFLATPARASGELTFDPDHGSVYVHHTKQGSGVVHNDIGADGETFPIGRITFDPHPIFRDPALVQLENAGVVTTESGAAAMRFDPPISLLHDEDTDITNVTIRVRVLAGDPFSIGGIAPVRLLLETDASTLSAPANPNAATASFEITTDQPAAWQEFLERACEPLDALEGVGDDFCSVTTTGETVTWSVSGAGSGNDIRLSTGLAIYDVTVS